ncbi:MAG: hypothetical protein AAF705_04940 [Bacteroidota bacterium]
MFVRQNETLLAIILTLFFQIHTLTAQSSQGITVQEIHFEGLKKTRVNYLRQFLSSKEGIATDSTTLKNDVQYLVNLVAVANASYQVDTLEEGLSITYKIEEALTAFPIINFGGVRGNFWFQLGFTDANWLGKGIQLSSFYQVNDGRNNFNLYYRVPFISGSRWGASGSFFKYASIEPLFFGDNTVFYNYDNTSIGATGIYQIDRNHNIEFGGTFFVEEYEKNSRHQGEVTPGPDSRVEEKVLGKLMHRIGRINYHYYLLKGFDNIANGQAVFNFDDQSWFFIFLNDTRYFKRIGKKGNLASRLRLGISTNNDTPFAPFVLDSYFNIRGSGNRIDRGTATAVLNLEYRHSFYDQGKFAGQVVAFSDLGTWRKPGGDFNELVNGTTLRHFIGGGVRLIYKKAFNAIFRLDYGIDLHNFDQRGVVVGLGQYF